MRKSELDAPQGPLPFNVPVICDRCRAEGIAGDPAFAAIPDILAFDPVPRRTHVNNWTAEHQRAFITALAITGSPRQAARALGRHSFGAEQLRSARGGRSFAAAWDSAIELARDREFSRIHTNLSDLAAQRDAELAVAPRATGATSNEGRPFDPDEDEDGRGEYLDAVGNIARRMRMCRRLLLAAIEPDPAKRAAWEVLVGPVDWERAERLEAQDDEPAATNPAFPKAGLPNMREADMVLTAEAGLLADFTGGRDRLAEIREAIEAEDRAGSLSGGEASSAIAEQIDLTPEERAALDAHRAGLIAEGWIEDEHGNLWSPDPTA